MTWNEAKTQIGLALQYDGDKGLSDTDTTIGSAWDTRLQLYLRDFTVRTLYLFSMKCTLTLADLAQSAKLTDNAVSALNMFQVRDLWINSTKIRQVDLAAIMALSDQGTVGKAATPCYWAWRQPDEIVFDTKLDGAPTSAYCQGWYRHPAITDGASTSQFLISEDDYPAFENMVQYEMRRNVVADQVGAARMAQIRAALERDIRMIRGRGIQQVMGDSGAGGW